MTGDCKSTKFMLIKNHFECESFIWICFYFILVQNQSNYIIILIYFSSICFSLARTGWKRCIYWVIVERYIIYLIFKENGIKDVETWMVNQISSSHGKKSFKFTYKLFHELNTMIDLHKNLNILLVSLNCYVIKTSVPEVVRSIDLNK